MTTHDRFLGRCPSALASKAERLARDIDRILRGECPAPEDLEDARFIDQWMFQPRLVPALVGELHRDPTTVGTRTLVGLTSEVFLLDEEAGWCRTWNRWYRLGNRKPKRGTQ